MEQSAKTILLMGWCDNLVSRVLLFVCGFALISFSVNGAYANDKLNPDSYKENSKLTSLLVKEKFQVGLSCDEAMKAHAMSEKVLKGKRARLQSSIVGFGEGKTVKPGFFTGGCLGNQLNYLEKIVSVEKKMLERNEIFDPFIKQYGKPSFQRSNGSNIQYYLLYKGRYVEFRVSYRQENKQTVIIYELEDLTAKINK